VGLGPRATDDWAQRLQAQVGGRRALAPWLAAAVLASGAIEGLDPEDRLAPVPVGRSSRDSANLGVELAAHHSGPGIRWQLRPALELGVAHSQVHGLASTDRAVPDRTQLSPT